MNRLFTIDGSTAFEGMIAEHMKALREEVLNQCDPNDIEAIILGGGYGRGEGGICVAPDGSEALFNDYDCFLISRGLSRKSRKELNKTLLHCGHHLERKFGIDVDFGHVVNVEDLGTLPFTQMWYDLQQGFYVIYGTQNVLDGLPAFDVKKMPLAEGAKLLLNRGTGLLLAREKMQGQEENEADLAFIERNIYKAAMAIGDVRLMMIGKYHASYVERLKIYQNEINDDYTSMYAEAVDYKLHPTYGTRSKQTLESLYNTVLSPFESVYYRLFSEATGIDCHVDNLWMILSRHWLSGEAPQKLKSMVLNVLEVSPRSMGSRLFWRYPRIRLYLVLPSLLFQPGPLTDSLIRSILGVNSSADEQLVWQQFMKLWNRFS